jgi:hypothetical protein
VLDQLACLATVAQQLLLMMLWKLLAAGPAKSTGMHTTATSA